MLNAVLIMIEMVPVAAVLHEEQSILLILEGELNRVKQFYDVGVRKQRQHFSMLKARVTSIGCMRWRSMHWQGPAPCK